MPQDDRSHDDAPATLATPEGARIAYHKSAGSKPGLVFLGGFMSDMTGSKATALERYARARGRAFLRFDYQGHGASSGVFRDGTIGTWAADALAAIDNLSEGPQILIGSSMGGWIMLLTALGRPDRIAGLVGIAAAPDFTEDLMWHAFSDSQRAELQRNGVLEQPSSYSEEPYTITRDLIEDGRRHLLLRQAIPIHCPVRLLHGTEDCDVPWKVSLKLLHALDAQDAELCLVKGGDHRLSEPQDLERLFRTLDGLLAAHDGAG